MTIDDKILDEAEWRWHQIVETRPDMASAVDLQRVLLTRGLELGADESIMTQETGAVPDDLFDRLSRLEAPVLELAVELDVDRLTPYLLGFCDDFAAGGAGDPARNVRRVLAEGEIDPGSLMRASLLRQQEPIRQRATHLGVSADLVWLIAELSVGPIAHRLQHAALASLETTDPAAQAAIRFWSRGHCAICGSWPALAESWSDHRHLRCSFCGADWIPPEETCVYCSRGGNAFITAADKDQSARRLEFCRSCSSYLKHVDVDGPTPFALLPVLDLETSDLDVRAVELGYRRPPMHERAVSPAPCPPNGVT